MARLDGKIIDARRELHDVQTNEQVTNADRKASVKSLQWLERRRKDEEMRLHLLPSRSTGPRCLACGSYQVVEVRCNGAEAADEGDESGGDAIGFLHPGCGGNILSQWAGVRVAPRRETLEYDIDGTRIMPVANRAEGNDGRWWHRFFKQSR